MEDLVNNLLFLLVLLPLIFTLGIYFSQKKIRADLRTKPQIEILPRTHYQFKLKELNIFKKKISKLPLDLYRVRKCEIYYLEQALQKNLLETKKEERKYQLAVLKSQKAWIDYKEVYLEIGFWRRTLSIKKNKELQLFRKLYLETKALVANEREKIMAKNRIWLQEEKNQHNSSHVSEANREKEKISDNGEKAVDNGEKTVDNGPVREETDSVVEPAKQNPKSEVTPTNGDATDVLSEQDKTAADGAGCRFTLAQYHDLYPNFQKLVFAEDTCSMQDQSISVIKGALFNHTVFRGVNFVGLHQFQDCNFTGTDFSNSLFSKSERPHRFLNCDFTDTLFTGCSFEFTAFYNCSFRNIIFENLAFKVVKFIDCSFEDCDLSNLDLSQSVMSSAMLQEIDFSNVTDKPKNWHSKVPSGKMIPQPS